MGLSDTQVMKIRTELQHNAALFDEPKAYMAGVEDALAAVRRHAGRQARNCHVVADRTLSRSVERQPE